MNKTIKLNIPEDIGGWRAIREIALTIYWDKRKNGATENQALLAVLDDFHRDEEACLREQQLDEADAINSRFAP